jgi:small neutral amino acid transporter SnatA (MarC family)
MSDFIQSTSLLLTLLNPFLIIIYLVDVIQKLTSQQFNKVLIRAGIISILIFCTFTILGDAIFSSFLHVEFASFQIFGGVIFLIIGIQFVFKGPSAIETLRGESAHIVGAIAMPVLVGPGTISASVVIGKTLSPLFACLSVSLATCICLITIVILKAIHDYVLPRNAALVERYFEIAGRITALYVGTVAIQMVMQGLQYWINKL